MTMFYRMLFSTLRGCFRSSSGCLAACLLLVLSAGSALASSKDVTNPDSCQGCHKREHAMLGLHSGDLFGPTNLVATCADCHGTGQDNDLHKLEAMDIRRFISWDQLTADSTPLAEQNLACTSCHDGEQLRTAHWTHDPHARVLTCASCHQLHGTVDPMRGLTSKARVSLCVDCHSELPEQAPGSLTRTGGAQ